MFKMKNVDVSKIMGNIIEGMKQSSQKLISLKKRSGSSVAISENGIVKEIEAKDL